MFFTDEEKIIHLQLSLENTRRWINCRVGQSAHSDLGRYKDSKKLLASNNCLVHLFPVFAPQYQVPIIT